MKTMGFAAVALGALVALAGCSTSDTNGNGTPDNVNVNVKTPARNAANDARNGAQQAGQTISNGMQNAGAEINEMKQEVDVRAALALDTAVDKSGITVKGDEAAHSIRLTGTVPTADQKTKAEQIAKDKAEGWTIINDLTVQQTASTTP
jgi:osmotically-inducible protein OsmY